MKKIRPTCDQCLYHEHCYDLLDASDCAAYKDKDKFVELPCQIGDYYFADKTPDWFGKLDQLFYVTSIVYDGDSFAIWGSHAGKEPQCEEVLVDWCTFVTKEEAQQWLADHGYDDILIGEMHE